MIVYQNFEGQIKLIESRPGASDYELVIKCPKMIEYALANTDDMHKEEVEAEVLGSACPRK